LADLRWESFYLQDRNEPAWIDKLTADIEALKTLLMAYPSSGRKLEESGSMVIRKLRLRQTPYYVWYSTDDADPASAVTLVRLFHNRQQAPQPRLR
jgi:plasmid stabilization system protein ParE